jgi:phosphoserine phosphatase
MNHLLTITGRDAPGITSALTAIIAQTGAELKDIEQVVVQGQLTLCLLIDLHNNKQILSLLKDRAGELGQELIVRELPQFSEKNQQRRYVLTVMADPVTAHTMHQISSLLAMHEANIENIRRLSHGDLSSLEIALSIQQENTQPLKEDLLRELSERSVDIALQRESLSRRNKRLVVMDMDSTLIQNEVIDELARANDVFAEVSAITHQAMSEGLDFGESLKQRVALLEGLSVSRLEQVVAELKLTPGAEDLVRVLKSLGYQMGIISGGFEQAANHFRDKLGLDFAYANRLEIEDGKLSGRVLAPVVDANRKADLLDIIAQSKQIPLEQVIAIGDGANDALMLAKAGLGIAFHAKPILKQAADTTISAGGLDRILYLLGIHGREIAELLR